MKCWNSRGLGQIKENEDQKSQIHHLNTKTPSCDMLSRLWTVPASRFNLIQQRSLKEENKWVE
jgi:hypothetical protein